MQNALEAEIVEAEEQLRTAMLGGDIDVLDRLLAPDLLFTNHLGQLLGKADDLAAYRSGVLAITWLSPSERQIRALDETAVVSVRMQISGTYQGAPTNGDFRFTRVWTRSQQQRWQIIAAHSVLIHQLP
jgi:ketosteroid isomerase-like protein